jgi:hypothetical protein
MDIIKPALLLHCMEILNNIYDLMQQTSAASVAVHFLHDQASAEAKAEAER